MAENNNTEKRKKIRNFYSASQKLDMGAAEWSFNSKDASVYLKMAPQIAYHADRRAKGEYNWKEAVVIKLDTNEVGGIIRALRTDGEFSFIHDFEGNKTTGSVKYFTTAKGTKGFGLSIKRGDKEVKCPIPVGGGEFLLEYLRFALDHIFSADYAADKKFFEALAAKKEKTAEKSPEPEPETSGAVDDSVEPPQVEDDPF